MRRKTSHIKLIKIYSIQLKSFIFFPNSLVLKNCNCNIRPKYKIKRNHSSDESLKIKPLLFSLSIPFIKFIFHDETCWNLWFNSFKTECKNLMYFQWLPPSKVKSESLIILLFSKDVNRLVRSSGLLPFWPISARVVQELFSNTFINFSYFWTIFFSRYDPHYLNKKEPFFKCWPAIKSALCIAVTLTLSFSLILNVFF